MIPRRTYWHLEALGRKPTDYEVVTSRLLYHPTNGFEVETPVAAWHREHEAGRKLKVRDWERFRDPRETTYARYTARRRDQEVFVDGLFATAAATGHDQELPPEWVHVLSRAFAPLRYPVHGLQMISAYLGSLAPSGRVVVTCLLQSADELRRIQRIAQRMRQIQEAHRGFGEDARALWQEERAWQPIRAMVERAMVAYDWTEAFVATNLVLKPALDQLFLVSFGEVARAHRDGVLQKMFLSLNEDATWQRDWSQVLVKMVAEEDPENLRVMGEIASRWAPEVRAAVRAGAELLGADTEAIAARVERFSREYLTGLGLGEEGER